MHFLSVGGRTYLEMTNNLKSGRDCQAKLDQATLLTEEPSNCLTRGDSGFSERMARFSPFHRKAAGAVGEDDNGLSN